MNTIQKTHIKIEGLDGNEMVARMDRLILYYKHGYTNPYKVDCGINTIYVSKETYESLRDVLTGDNLEYGHLGEPVVGSICQPMVGSICQT